MSEKENDDIFTAIDNKTIDACDINALKSKLETLRTYNGSNIQQNYQTKLKRSSVYLENLIEQKLQEERFRKSTLSMGQKTLRIAIWTLVAAVIAVIVSIIGIILNK